MYLCNLKGNPKEKVLNRQYFMYHDVLAHIFFGSKNRQSSDGNRLGFTSIFSRNGKLFTTSGFTHVCMLRCSVSFSFLKAFRFLDLSDSFTFFVKMFLIYHLMWYTILSDVFILVIWGSYGNTNDSLKIIQFIPLVTITMREMQPYSILYFSCNPGLDTMARVDCIVSLPEFNWRLNTLRTEHFYKHFR